MQKKSILNKVTGFFQKLDNLLLIWGEKFMTYGWGYYFNQGKRVGYDITFSNSNGTFILYNVSSKDKARVIREIIKDGYTKEEITVERKEN